MIQISFEFDALAKAIMETVGEGSWEHWCPDCEHVSHYFGECGPECACTADGGYDREKSGPVPWDRLPDGDEYEYGGRKVLNFKGKDHWRAKAEKLLAAL
jgi:hypothetical protein